MPRKKSKPVELPDTTGGQIHLYVHNDRLSEFVEIENGSHIEQPLTGWSLATLTGEQIYTFAPVVLPPGGSMRIHSGSDPLNAPPHDWTWTTENIWSNRADVAVLFDTTGTEIARYAYPDAHRAGSTCHKEKMLINANNQAVIIDRPARKKTGGAIRRLQH